MSLRCHDVSELVTLLFVTRSGEYRLDGSGVAGSGSGALPDGKQVRMTRENEQMRFSDKVLRTQQARGNPIGCGSESKSRRTGGGDECLLDNVFL